MSTPEYSIDNDPLFKEISIDKKQEINKIVKTKIQNMSLDEIVDKDTMKIPGQNYALISILSPQSNQKNTNICLKIKGTFDKLEDAQKMAETLQKIDPTFDIYVVEMYSWLLLPPDPELIEQVHVDNKLNEIISGHRESQLNSKMYFEERKRELLENGEIENDKKKNINEEEKRNAVPENIVPESNGDNCPNSGPSSSALDLLNSMSNELNINPSKSWADKVEEEEEEKVEEEKVEEEKVEEEKVEENK